MSDFTAITQMIIRKPPMEVFDAFVNPRVIEKFWLKRASAPLTKGATVEWEFMVDGANETVTVTEIISPNIIAFNWSDGLAVKMTFEPFDTHSTIFSVAATGFSGADAASQAVNATEGFAIVACDLKSLLETGHSGNMVRDKAALISAAK